MPSRKSKKSGRSSGKKGHQKHHKQHRQRCAAKKDVEQNGRKKRSSLVNGVVISTPIVPDGLVEVLGDQSHQGRPSPPSRPKDGKEEEVIRQHIKKEMERPGDSFYLQERLLAMELSDDFRILLGECAKIDSKKTESAPSSLSSVGMHQSPRNMLQMAAEAEGRALVRAVEAFYIDHGLMTPVGRILREHEMYCHKLLHPFGGAQLDETSHHAKLPGRTAVEIVDCVRCIYESNFSGLLFCRALVYCLYRMETPDSDDTLLDVYCIAMYSIMLLQGKLDEFMNMNFGDVIEDEVEQYLSQDVDITADDLLWCFSLVLLRAGCEVRRKMGCPEFFRLVTEVWGQAVNEELLVAQLCIQIRHESPMGYLLSYLSIMDMKKIIPEKKMYDWLKTAYNFLLHGLSVAETWGDPYFTYTFSMIMAYWIPTTTNAPNPYSYDEIQQKIEEANDIKESCKNEVPKYSLWAAEYHETALLYLLAISDFDKEAELTEPLVHAALYPFPVAE